MLQLLELKKVGRKRSPKKIKKVCGVGEGNRTGEARRAEKEI